LQYNKRTNMNSILLYFNLILTSTGLSNLTKAMSREKKIKSFHPKKLMYYLWFIGVDTKEQNKGIGTSLLRELINRSISINRPVYLETSTMKNIPWYQKFGFKIYNELDLGYRLYFMKKE
jgi:ribosomal protein S18 acetylase RimI-like enzyme